MANGFNTSPFVLPQMFDKPGDVLQQGLARKERQDERQYEIDYRNQRNKEQDDFRKLGMIQKFTNLEKYQTGNDVADALGGEKMGEVLQKYTLLSGSMSMPELQYKLSQETANTHNSMRAMKDEFVQFSQQLPLLQKMYPSLNTKALEQKYREDVINRRIENNEFSNPTHIAPSTINLNDPETLADFIAEDSDKIISKEILNPQLYQTEHRAKGNRDSYSKFTEKLSPFVKSNLTPDSYNADKFLKSDVDPQIKFDSNSEDLFGKKIETLSPQAYKAGFSSEANIAFIAMAKRGMPQWSKMTPEEKDKSVRAIALEYVQKLDKSGYSFENANPPAARTTNNINMGTGGGVNDIHGRISKKVEDNFSKGYSATRFNSLANDEQGVVKTAIENTGYNIEQGGSNVFIWREKDGTIKVYATTGGKLIPSPDKEITTLPFIGTNISKQPGLAEKRLVVNQGNKPTDTQYTNVTETNKGKIGYKNGKWYDIATGKEIKQ